MNFAKKRLLLALALFAVVPMVLAACGGETVTVVETVVVVEQV